MEDKIFKLSLVVSFLLHLFAFASLFYAHVHHARKPPRPLEVVYQTEFKDLPRTPKKVKRVSSAKEKKLTPDPDILSKSDFGPEALMDKAHKRPVRLSDHKKKISSLPASSMKRQIRVPVIKAEKITNPRYLNYHELIRNKIKNRAYFYVDDPDFETGEVYLTFILSSQGELQRVKVIENETKANDFLRAVGIRSIKESGPFPSFPKELEYPELTFNVVISFELGE